MGNIGSFPVLAWTPENLLVGLYDIGGDSVPTGSMGFSETAAITLTGFNETSQYYNTSRSEKLVAIRFEFFEQNIVKREVVNVTMATSNATGYPLQPGTIVSWTINTSHVEHTFDVDNLRLGDNTFYISFEFEIDVIGEPTPVTEEIGVLSILHADGPILSWPVIIILLGVLVLILQRRRVGR